MGTLGAIIGTIIFGAVIGMLARLALPGKQQTAHCSPWRSAWPGP